MTDSGYGGYRPEGINLDNFDQNSLQSVNSLTPRSKEACVNQGILLHELVKLDEKAILDKFPELTAHPELIPKISSSYEKKRISRVQEARQERSKMISREHAPSFLLGTPAKSTVVLAEKEIGKLERLKTNKRKELQRVLQLSVNRQQQLEKAAANQARMEEQDRLDHERKSKKREESRRALEEKEAKRNAHIEHMLAEKNEEVRKKSIKSQQREVERARKLLEQQQVAKENAQRKHEARKQRQLELAEAMERTKQHAFALAQQEAERKQQEIDERKRLEADRRHQRAEAKERKIEEALQRVEEQAKAKQEEWRRHMERSAHLDAFKEQEREAEKAERAVMAKLQGEERAEIKRRREMKIEATKRAMEKRMQESEARLEEIRKEQARIREKKLEFERQGKAESERLAKLVETIEHTGLDSERVEQQAKKLGITGVKDLLSPSGKSPLTPSMHRIPLNSPSASPGGNTSGPKSLSESLGKSAAISPRPVTAGAGSGSPAARLVATRPQTANVASPTGILKKTTRGKKKTFTAPRVLTSTWPSMTPSLAGEEVPLQSPASRPQSRVYSHGLRNAEEGLFQDPKSRSHKRTESEKYSASAVRKGDLEGVKSPSKRREADLRDASEVEPPLSRAQAEQIIETLAVKQNSKLMRLLEVLSAHLSLSRFGRSYYILSSPCHSGILSFCFSSFRYHKF